MRVGFYMQDLQPETGGGFTFEQDILQALLTNRTRSTHTFVILCSDRIAAWIRARFGEQIDVAVLPTSGRFGRVRDAALRCVQGLRAVLRGPTPLDRIARANQVDFIWFAGSGVVCTDLPYLTVVWDLQHRSMPWFPEFSARGLWDRREMSLWFLRRASAVVSGTRAGADELVRWIGVPIERILILPHPTPAFATEPRVGEAQLPASLAKGSRPFLFYPAQFWPHKNHVNLVMGFGKLIRELGADFDLVLSGSDKGNRAHVERCIEAQGLRDRVHLVGFVSREELKSLYQHAFALTYLSWGGPENLPPLEAFALGCPVIAANIPGAEEQLGDAALLVDPADPSQIAEAIARLHGTPALRSELITRGKVRAAGRSGSDYVHGVFAYLDQFESVSRCWAGATGQ